MGLMNFFTGKPFEALEQKGDDFFNTGAYGHAKITYEKALHKLEKKSSEPSSPRRRSDGGHVSLRTEEEEEERQRQLLNVTTVL